MKPLWAHALVWLAAVAAALVLTSMAPDGIDLRMPHGADVPR